MARTAVALARWVGTAALLLAVPLVTLAGDDASGAAGPSTAPGWTAVAPPLQKAAPAGSHPLVKDVTCPAPGSCVAVGSITLGGTPARSLAWAAVLSGASWAAVTLPVLPDVSSKASSELSGVSCPTRDYCVAVGSYAATGGPSQSGLVETDTDGVWSVATTPAPDTEGSVLDAVDCLMTRTCTASGRYQNPGTGTTGEIVITGSGSVWSSTTAPVPANALPGTTRTARVTPIYVSCATLSHCAAGGQYENVSGRDTALLDVQTGGSWVNVPVTGLPSGAKTSHLTSVSCPAPGTCVAVVTYQTAPTGTVVTKPRYTGSVIATWSGGKLTTQAAPLPTGAITGKTATFDLYQLSCPAAGACVAVGYYRPQSTASQGLIETLDDGTWSPSTLPLPTGADTGTTATVTVNAVDCPDLGQCTAVGQYHVDHKRTAFVATLTAGSWTAARLALPNGAKATDTSSVLTVSCAAGACAAGGLYTDATDKQVTMLLSFTPSFSGYDLVGSDGGVFVLPVGQAGGFYGSLPTIHVVPAAPVVGMVPTVSDKGYFLVGADGGVYAFGNAPFLGSLPGLKVTPAQPITGIVAADGDHGYFLVGKDGGVYAFGTVPFLGSLPGDHVSVSDIIGIAATPSGDGYWLMGATGTVYAFGAAQHFGNATGLTSAVSAIAGTPTGGGYWITTKNGTVKAFGDAATFTPGTLPAIPVTPALPVIGIVRTAETTGYWLLGQDGGIFAFGTAPFDGSLPGLGVHVTDVVGAVPT